MSRICLYENAKSDVRYVYGSPVKFTANKAVLGQREKDKENMIKSLRKETK